MQLVISRNATSFELSVNYDTQIAISLSDNPLVTEDLFRQLWYNMSYTDLINWIGEDSFLNVTKFYHEEYTNELT